MVNLNGSRVESKKSGKGKIKFQIILPQKDEFSVITWTLDATPPEGQQWLDCIIKHKAELEDHYLQLYQLHEIQIEVSTIEVIQERIWGGCEDLKIKLWDPVNWELTKELDLKEKFTEMCKNPYPLNARDLRITKMLEHNGFVWIGVTKWVAGVDTDYNIVGVLTGHTLRVNDIVGDNDKLWTCADDGTVRVWGVAAGQFCCIQVLTPNQGKLYSVIKADNFISSTGWSGIINIWDEEHQYQSFPKNGEQIHKDAIVVQKFWRNSVWAGSWDGTISIWK